MTKILIIGGDRRQIELRAMLKKTGSEVAMRGFGLLGLIDEEMAEPDYVFLPIPYKMPDGSIKAPYAKNPIEFTNIISTYTNSVYVLGGCDSAALQAFGSKIRYIDLLEDEPFLIRNALLTAQAAICAYATQTDTALCETHSVVVGYGRIGKLLCRLLAANGAKVTATARKYADLEMIRAEGYNALHTDNIITVLPDADVIWNTVPAHVLDTSALVSLRESAQIIELASPPYGMDIKAAKELGVCVRMEQGLPGRYFPISAARAMLHAFERKEQIENGA